MKKSLFGLSAKVAMAVLAVCSFVLTSCYEKQAPNQTQDPVYYVVGTVYDGTTAEAIDASVKVNGNSVTVNNGSFITEVNAAGAVTVDAEADGYISVSRTVQVAPAADNQISVTSADIAMFKELVNLDVVSTGVGNLDSDALISQFGFPEGTTVDENNLITVCTHVDIQTHDGHGATTQPVEVEIPDYSGSVWNFEGDSKVESDLKEIVAAVVNAPVVGTSYADLLTGDNTKETINEQGDWLLCYYIHSTFKQVEVSYLYDNNLYKVTSVSHVGTLIEPVFESHDSHDTHDAHHDGHDNHGHSNAGGGAGDAE